MLLTSCLKSYKIEKLTEVSGRIYFEETNFRLQQNSILSFRQTNQVLRVHNYILPYFTDFYNSQAKSLFSGIKIYCLTNITDK